MRLIDADALLEAFKSDQNSEYYNFGEAMELVINAPAIEQPQKVKDALKKAANIIESQDVDPAFKLRMADAIYRLIGE